MKLNNLTMRLQKSQGFGESEITPLLLLIPGPLWLPMVALDWVLSMDQIELNCVLMQNWIVWNELIFDSEIGYLY